jgi:hypothetical protein
MKALADLRSSAVAYVARKLGTRRAAHEVFDDCRRRMLAHIEDCRRGRPLEDRAAETAIEVAHLALHYDLRYLCDLPGTR